MIITDTSCCTATLEVHVNADKMFNFISNPTKLGDWAFGSFRPIKSMGDNVYSGTSMFDGGQTLFRINPYPKFRQCDYEVGYLGGELLPWIIGRVTPGPVLGLGNDVCLFTLMAWRHKDWKDEDWRLICASHEAETFRARYLVESEK